MGIKILLAIIIPALILWVGIFALKSYGASQKDLGVKAGLLQCVTQKIDADKAALKERAEIDEEILTLDEIRINKQLSDAGWLRP